MMARRMPEPREVWITGIGLLSPLGAGIEAKLVQWEAMQDGVKWSARNILFGPNVICIEWDAEVSLKDGRVVPMPEIAIHEIEGGKIARERYYYNPLVLAPPSR